MYTMGGAFQVGQWGRGFPGGTQFSSVTQSCPALCDPMDCSTPGLPVHHQLPEFTRTHVVLKKKIFANAGRHRDVDLIPGLERSTGGGTGKLLQCFCLENPMDRGPRRAKVHGVEELDTTQ